MSYSMKIADVSCAPNKNGKESVGLYGDIVDQDGNIAEAGAVVHLSMMGNALPITKEQLAKLGYQGNLVEDIPGKTCPVKPVVDPQPGYDTWEVTERFD